MKHKPSIPPCILAMVSLCESGGMVSGGRQSEKPPAMRIIMARLYKRERQLRGTQKDVARRLGVNRVTVARRETGVLPISQECALALLALPKQK